MKKVGYFLITIGFLAGALVAVVDESKIQWFNFSGAIIFGVVGIIAVRLHEHKRSRSDRRLAMSWQDVKNSLSRIVENISQLNKEKKSINVYDMRERIDEIFAEDLASFVEETKLWLSGSVSYKNDSADPLSTIDNINRSGTSSVLASPTYQDGVFRRGRGSEWF